VHLDHNSNERYRNHEHLKLTEIIILSYRKQIDARRALLELDSALMDLTHERKRNQSIIDK
jgi:hypothetical protein